VSTQAHQAHAIHRVPGVRGGNVYLLTTGPLTLVDSGLPGSGRAVLEFMAALGFRPADLKRVLITHRHPDHAGAAAFLREATGAQVHAHAGDVNELPDGAFLRGSMGTAATSVDAVLHGGEVLEPGIRVIHCGGHTSGSVCYFLESSRALFLGDMAINNIDRLSRPISFSNEDREAYDRGLQSLTEIDAGSLFFGHGPPLYSGGREALEAMQAREPSPAWQAPFRLLLLRLRSFREGRAAD